jgi:hypothetical protein
MNQPLDLSAALAITRPVCTVEICGVLEAADLATSLQRGDGSPSQVATSGGDLPPTPQGRHGMEETAPGDLKKLRAKHHSVARLIASGLNQRMVANLSGYTESYLSILLGSPSMAELVMMYQQQLGSRHDILAERLRTVADEAVGEIEERLDDPTARQSMEVGDLLGIAKLGLDRSGHGPSSSTHITGEQHIFDHAELRKRDKEARGQSADRIIDQAPPSLPPPSDGD